MNSENDTFLLIYPNENSDLFPYITVEIFDDINSTPYQIFNLDKEGQYSIEQRHNEFYLRFSSTKEKTVKISLVFTNIGDFIIPIDRTSERYDLEKWDLLL